MKVRRVDSHMTSGSPTPNMLRGGITSRILTNLVFLSLLIGTAPAEARNPNVLIYCGHGGECQDGFDHLSDQLAKAGAARITEQSDWPTNLSDYHIVFFSIPREPFDDEQVEQIKQFLVNNAANPVSRLVMIAEYNSYSGGSIEVINDLTTRLGYSMRLDTNEIECGCEQQTHNVATHFLTAGMDYMEFACTTSITINDGVALAYTNESSPFIAIEQGNLIIAGDSNIFTDFCGEYDLKGNLAFFTNLIISNQRAQ